MDIWLPINPPICGNCGRAALFETASDDWRKPSEVVCPYCGAHGMSPRALKMSMTPKPRDNNREDVMNADTPRDPKDNDPNEPQDPAKHDPNKPHDPTKPHDPHAPHQPGTPPTPPNPTRR